MDSKLDKTLFKNTKSRFKLTANAESARPHPAFKNVRQPVQQKSRTAMLLSQKVPQNKPDNGDKKGNKPIHSMTTAAKSPPKQTKNKPKTKSNNTQKAVKRIADSQSAGDGHDNGSLRAFKAGVDTKREKKSLNSAAKSLKNNTQKAGKRIAELGSTREEHHNGSLQTAKAGSDTKRQKKSMNSSAESFKNVGTFYDSEQSNGEEDVSDDDSTDFDDLEYMDDSSSEYSLDDDKDFFLKPDVIVADRRGYTPFKFADVDQDEEKLWKSTEDINAEVTKILVYDDIMSETDQNTNQNTDTDAEEDLEEQQDEEDLEKQQFEEEDRFEVQQEEMANEEGQLEEVNIFENSFKNNNVLAVLKSDVELYGTVVVSLLCGRITINGYKAPALELLSIYSPKGFNWINITPMASKKPVKDNYDWSQLQDQFSRAQLDNIRSNYDSQKDAVVLLQRNSSAQQLVNIFSKHMSQNVFPLINATNRPYYASEYLLNCLIQRASGNNTLQVPRAWSKLTFQPESRFILTGGKGVGKSTMLRYLLNRQLKHFPRLLLIDLDIGQPELFVPQTVSCTLIDAPLLGPGFLLNKQPDYAIMVGHVNIVMCAEQYMRAVRKLLVYCHSSSSYENIPWLINTMGYNKGFGYEFMALLINCIQPTDVLQIASTKAINNFDKALDHKNIIKVVPIIYTTDEFKLDASELPKYTHHPLLSAVPARQSKSWLMSAKDLRYANLLTRLSVMLRGNAKYITECQPMRVPLSKLHILHLNSTDYTREELIRGMEANVVYLCKHLTDKEPVECLGIGVVRAIDYKQEQLYLVPAMPLASLSQVNCLFMGGDMYLPQSFFKDQGLNVANQVPFVFLIDDCKSSKSIQQIYHRAPGFLGNRQIKLTENK